LARSVNRIVDRVPLQERKISSARGSRRERKTHSSLVGVVSGRPESFAVPGAVEGGNQHRRRRDAKRLKYAPHTESMRSNRVSAHRNRHRHRFPDPVLARIRDGPVDVLVESEPVDVCLRECVSDAESGKEGKRTYWDRQYGIPGRRGRACSCFERRRCSVRARTRSPPLRYRPADRRSLLPSS
jgi:hypothetical protein